MEPRRVADGVQVNVGPCREAVAVGLWGQDVEDGQEEADQPGTAHPEQSLRDRELVADWSHPAEPLTAWLERRRRHSSCAPLRIPRWPPCFFMRQVFSYHFITRLLPPPPLSISSIQPGSVHLCASSLNPSGLSWGTVPHSKQVRALNIWWCRHWAGSLLVETTFGMICIHWHLGAAPRRYIVWFIGASCEMPS